MLPSTVEVAFVCLKNASGTFEMFVSFINAGFLQVRPVVKWLTLA